ncbi:hypothetical protein ACRYI5_00495 [Furfurilactobacillus sp. WILCCON 0119]
MFNKSLLEVTTAGPTPEGYTSVELLIATSVDSNHLVGFKEKDLDKLLNQTIHKLKKRALENKLDGISNIRISTFGVTPQSSGPDLAITILADGLKKV